MNSQLLKFYHHLPPSIRSAAASLRGFYLQSWRYGPETERLVAEALDREHWTPSQWKTWREERLAYVLHRAATQVPHYREQWAARRRQGDHRSWQYLENWPLLAKEPLRENPASFVADGCSVRRMFHEHTSGTSGKPLDLWWSRETVRAWYALFEARCRRWYDVSRHDRWAILGGQLVVPVDQRRPPFWVWNEGLRQLYLSSFHLATDLIPYYLDALRSYRVKYILGYTSSLNALAQGIRRVARHDLRMSVVVANAEPVFDHQRQAIAEAFQCPVRETYGMAEIVAAASECGQGRLHLWPETGWVEVLEGGQPASPGSVGDFVCTGLLNADMPLVRYSVGDRGGLLGDELDCGCGRRLPIVSGIQGRINDLLITRDGRKVYWLNPIFYGLPVCEAQIIQETLERVRVRYVLTSGHKSSVDSAIAERLRARMGQVEVVLEPVPQIPREANGKFRAVICQISREDHAVLAEKSS